MKKLFPLFVLLFNTLGLLSQNPALKVEKFVLGNGFTVYLNVDKTAKDVYGAVVVKAGSKNDPAEATGMAHYLEHLLFKGTTELGTTHYELEKPFLDSINIYYDLLGKTKDETERKKLQLLINNQSLQAAKYGLPTEFDKLIKSIGGTGLNAFTTNDMTVFHNSFPGEQMEKWLELYSHRFQHPVFRSFQSELEVVYEEKNLGMDNFGTKLIEEMNKNLFRFHPYGTQTTIGTVEHLKNPSLTKMYEYFNNYYVANNMALVLCGNFDAEKTLAFIKEKFSKLRTGIVPSFPKFPETVFKKKEVLNVRYTPMKVAIAGFKTVPKLHPDNAALDIFSGLLSNNTETGRFDKLRLEGKFIGAAALNYSFNDDGAMMFLVVPKLLGQSIKKAERIMLGEVEKIKNGEISETEFQIIKTELYTGLQSELENYRDRTLAIVEAFGEGSTWEEHLKYIKRLQEITKEDVTRVANKYFGENYFAIHSKTGFPKKEKLQKPGYKPVVTDQKEESEYAKNFKKIILPVAELKILNFEKDATLTILNESNKLYVTPNPINDIFTLKAEFQVGSDSLKRLDLSAELLNQFRTKELTLSKLKEEFALLGLTYSADCSNSRFTISFTGIESNLTQSLSLINKLINEATVEDKTIKILRRDILTGRKAGEKEPSTLGMALMLYAKFGNKSSYIDRISKKELRKVKASDLLGLYKKAITYDVVWHYVGNKPTDSIKYLINHNITLHNSNKANPVTWLRNNSATENIIYLLHDDQAVQSQIYFIVNSDWVNYSPEKSACISVFNEYMGGGFSGLILQEIREYRSLAYSTYGYFSNNKMNKSAYFFSYIGCQADKTNEAIIVMDSLINDMPQKPERMDDTKSLLKKSANANYPDFRYISTAIEYSRQTGDSVSRIKEIYDQYDSVTFDELEKFYEGYIQNRPMIITVYGNKTKMDLDKLARYGKIIELKKKDIILK